MSGDRVTLATLDQKLEMFMEQVMHHMADDARLFEKIAIALDGNGKPGLKTRIEINEKNIDDIKASRSMHIKAVWSTLTAVVAALIISFLKG
jgi:hypothetical protein